MVLRIMFLLSILMVTFQKIDKNLDLNHGANFYLTETHEEDEEEEGDLAVA